MIPKPALTAWFERAATEPPRSLGDVADVHRWRGQPPLAALAKALDTLAAPSVEDVGRLLIEALRDTAWLDRWIDALAAGARADPFFEPPLVPLNNGYHVGLQLFSHPFARLSVGVLPVDRLAAKKARRRGPAAITFTGTVSLQKFIKADNAVLTMWRATPATADFELATAPGCRVEANRTLADGDLLWLDGRRQSYVVERATADLVVLQAEILVDPAPLLVEYDADTRQPVSVCSTDDGASRTQMLLSFLRCLGKAHAGDVAGSVTDSPHFFVRWHAMRELLAMDIAFALPHLRAMAAADPHAEVRRTAAGVLAMLNPHNAMEGLCRA